MGICWGEGGETAQANCSNIKSQRYHKHTPYLPPSLSCSFVTTTESPMPPVLLLWDWAPTSLVFTFIWWNCNKGKSRRRNVGTRWPVIWQHCWQTKQLSATLRQQSNQKYPTWACILANSNMDIHVWPKASHHSLSQLLLQVCRKLISTTKHHETTDLPSGRVKGTRISKSFDDSFHLT